MSWTALRRKRKREQSPPHQSRKVRMMESRVRKPRDRLC